MARKQKLRVVKAKAPPDAPITAADALRRLIAHALASKWRTDVRPAVETPTPKSGPRSPE